MAGQRATEADVRIGTRLNEARRAAGLTQRVVADALSVSPAQLQKYERGINRIAAANLAVVARITGRPIGWFFEEVEPAKVADQTVAEAA